MNAELYERELQIKLNILDSLAASQRALSQLLQHAADTQSCIELHGKLLENIDLLSDYQRMIALKLCSIRIRERKKGRPTSPWLASVIDCTSSTSDRLYASR